MPDDLPAKNRRLLAQVRRREDDLAVLQERLTYAQQQIRELGSRVPAN